MRSRVAKQRKLMIFERNRVLQENERSSRISPIHPPMNRKNPGLPDIVKPGNTDLQPYSSGAPSALASKQQQAAAAKKTLALYASVSCECDRPGRFRHILSHTYANTRQALDSERSRASQPGSWRNSHADTPLPVGRPAPTCEAAARCPWRLARVYITQGSTIPNLPYNLAGGMVDVSLTRKRQEGPLKRIKRQRRR